MNFRTILIAAMLLLPILPAAASNGWQELETTPEGFRIELKEEPGRALPSMRATGVLRGDILHVLAVILDSERSSTWSGSGESVRILKRRGPLAEMIYTQTDLAWPMTNRDMVVRGEFEVRQPGKEFRVSTRCVPDELPKKEGMIRIRDCSAQFVLKNKANGQVWIEYVVNVDPGGKLPTWVARMASKSIPGGTLLDLQKQVDRTRGEYDETIETLRAL